jgi:hypothetical protein
VTSHQLTASLDTTSEPDLPDTDGGREQRGPRPTPSKSGWLHRRWVRQVVFVAAGIALFVAYTAQARTAGDTSDSGAKALQAWDMLHGNVLLRGWTLSDVSFYTTELPQYMLVELARGLTGDTVHVAGALTYTLMVLLAGLLAKGRATGREGLIRLLTAVGILLAPLHAGTHLLLAGPDHTGTQVPLLLIWIVLDRARPRWWGPAVIAVLLVWAQVADTLVLYEGVLPLVVVCAVRMYRRRGPLAAQWYELSLATGAVGSAVGAKLILVVIRHAGGFVVGTPIASFATASDMFTGLPQKAQSSLDVFSARFFGMPFGSAAIVVLIHLAGVALVAWAVAVALHSFCREADLMTQVLAVAFVVLLAAYLVGTKPDSQEVIGLLPIGAVLAGRVLTSRLIRAGLVPAMALVLACYGGILVSQAVQPPAPPGENQLAASWLQAHHLSYGLAGYWQANSITVEDGDRVQIRPVRVLNHELVITPAESDASWYDARRHDAHFVVWAPPGSCLNVCLSMASLRQILGPPTATYQVGTYRVLVRRQNLLTSLHTLWWCGNVWPWATSHQPSATPCE